MTTAAPRAATWNASRRRGTKNTATARIPAPTLTAVCSHPSESTWPQMLNGDGREAW